jgi:hypothetical protein
MSAIILRLLMEKLREKRFRKLSQARDMTGREAGTPAEEGEETRDKFCSPCWL